MLLLMVVAAAIRGQIYEDRLDPEEIGIADLEGLTVPAAVYVGNAVCQQCHAAAFRQWLGTRHARASVPLHSGMAMKIAMLAGVNADAPTQSGRCLSCHATGHDVPAAYRGPLFRMGEGVSCEKCHGPGENHVRAQREGGRDQHAAMTRPTEADCWRCHAPRRSHAMVCDDCHGDRAAHVCGMGGDAAAGTVPTEEDCWGCHRRRASHLLLLDGREYGVEEAWKQIVHGLDPQHPQG